jgi:hypothetical protein
VRGLCIIVILGVTVVTAAWSAVCAGGVESQVDAAVVVVVVTVWQEGACRMCGEWMHLLQLQDRRIAAAAREPWTVVQGSA